MKQLLLITSLFVFLFTCSFSCNKSHNNHMSAKVSGAEWLATEALATHTTEGVTLQGTLHYSSGDYSNIAVYLPRGYTTGTYNIDTAMTSAHGTYIPHAYDNSINLAVSGTVVVNSVSPNIQGTFTFVCADSTIIEQGNFSMKAP